MTRMRRYGALLGAALLTAMMPGLTAAQDDAGSPEGTEWGLTTLGTEMTTVPDGVEATLLLDGGQASGSAGCNQFSGSYELDGSSLTFATELALTRMACEGDAQGVEDAYMALLPTTASWQTGNGMLQLLDADDAVILEYVGPGSMPEPDLATVIALLEALQAEVGELRSRVDALESDGTAARDEDTTTPAKATKPAKPSARGKAKTEFPDWMRDEYRPESERSDEKNRETVRWRDRADDEDGYRVFAQRRTCELKKGVAADQPHDESDYRIDRGKVVLVDKLPANTTEYRPDHAAIDAALPAASTKPHSNDQFYDLLVAAYNDAGVSKRVKVGSFYLTPEFRCP